MHGVNLIFQARDTKYIRILKSHKLEIGSPNVVVILM